MTHKRSPWKHVKIIKKDICDQKNPHRTLEFEAPLLSSSTRQKVVSTSAVLSGQIVLLSLVGRAGGRHIEGTQDTTEMVRLE